MADTTDMSELMDRYKKSRDVEKLTTLENMFLGLRLDLQESFRVWVNEHAPRIDPPTGIDLFQPAYVDAVTQGGDLTFPVLRAPKVCPTCNYLGGEQNCPNDGELLV